MSYWLYTLEPGDPVAPASEQDLAAWEQALSQGKPFTQRGYHGYTLKVVVRKREQKTKGIS